MMDNSTEEQLKALYAKLNQQHEQHRAMLLACLAEQSISPQPVDPSATSTYTDHPVHDAPTIRTSVVSMHRRWFTRLSLAASILIICGASLLLMRAALGGRTAYADVIAHFDRSFKYEVTIKFPGMPASVEYRVKSDSLRDGQNHEIVVESPRGTHRATIDPEGNQIGGSFQPHDALGRAHPNRDAPALGSLQSPVKPASATPDELASKTDWLNVLRRGVGSERTLGNNNIDGAEVIGYEVESNGTGYKLWATRQTGVPVLIEIAASYLPGTLQISQFSFN